MIVYKVVRKTAEGFRSAVIEYGPFCLSYALGKETKAPWGTLGIMCFETQAEAKFFIRHDLDWIFDPLMILRVRGKRARKVGGILSCIRVSAMKDLKSYRFWLRYPEGATPKGTRVFKSITPLEVI